MNELAPDEEQENRTWFRKMARLLAMFDEELAAVGFPEETRRYMLAAYQRNFFLTDQRNQWAMMEKALGDAMRHGLATTDD